MSYQRGSNDNEMSHAIHKEYTTIDILKFLLSILVVSIHTHPFEYRSSIADLIVSNVFARLAVPFFFISAGFFISDKSATSYAKYRKRVLWLYVIYSTLYTPFMIRSIIGANCSFLHGLLLLIRYFIFGYGSLWFLSGLIWSSIFLSILNHLGGKYLCKIVIVLLMGQMGLVYLNATSSGLVFAITENAIALMNALIYVLAGYVIAGVFKENDAGYIFFRRTLLALGVGFLIIILLYEWNVSGGFTQLVNILLFIPSLSLFVEALAYSKRGFFRGSFNGKRMRSYATLIYLWHPIALNMIATRIHDQTALFILTLITTFLIASIILIIQRYCKLLRWIY